MTKHISQTVRELLETRIDSFDKLELVMTLRRVPHMTTSVQELADKIQIPREVVRGLVVELRGVSLVELTFRGYVQLVAPTPDDERNLAELSRLYESDPVHVILILSEIAMERIRAMASRAFARVRRRSSDRDDGDHD